MKQIFTVLAALSVLSLAGISSAADGVKLASVDLGKIAQESKAGSEAKKELEKLKDKLGQNLKKKEAELDKLRSSLEGKGKKLTDSERSAKAKEFEKKIEAYRETAQNAQKELQAKGDEYGNKIMDALEKLIKDYAEKNGYALVIRKSDLLYNDEKNKVSDITGDIMKLFDAPPAPSAPTETAPAK